MGLMKRCVRAMCLTGLAVVVAAGCAALAGCGGDDEAASSRQANETDGGAAVTQNVTDAKANVARLMKPYDEFVAPGPAFDASKAAGKTAWFISLDQSLPSEALASRLMTEALAKANVKTEVCDGHGTPDGWKKCVDLAVARHGDAMVLESFSPDLVADGLKRAQAAGIKVIDGNNGDPGDPLFAHEDARVAFPYSEGGRAVADWVIADSNGKADVLIAYTSDAPNWKALVTNGYVAQFKEKCPDCKVTTKNVPISQWATSVQPLVQSSIVANPKLNYIIPAFDGMSTYVVPGIQQAGAADRVKIATFNANLDPMRNLQQENTIYEDLGTHNPYLGYAYADQTLRLLAGEEPLKDEKIPLRMFTRDNVADLEITKEALESGVWYGTADIKAGFTDLWDGE